MTKTPITNKAMKWFENEMISNDIENHIKKTMAKLETKLNEAKAKIKHFEKVALRMAIKDQEIRGDYFRMKALLKQALEALEAADKAHDKIYDTDFGYDGDCGVINILASQDELMDAAIQAIQDELEPVTPPPGINNVTCEHVGFTEDGVPEFVIEQVKDKEE